MFKWGACMQNVISVYRNMNITAIPHANASNNFAFFMFPVPDVLKYYTLASIFLYYLFTVSLPAYILLLHVVYYFMYQRLKGSTKTKWNHTKKDNYALTKTSCFIVLLVFSFYLPLTLVNLSCIKRVFFTWAWVKNFSMNKYYFLLVLLPL